jgi:SAM-dependent methyltransferase
MLQLLSHPEQHQTKEQLYITVRAKEGRVPDDQVVRLLPDTPPDSPLRQEWSMRKRTLKRLKKHLLRKYGEAPIQILDLGCGNGWMANRLAENPNWQVTAADVNMVELEQADRLFARDNLQFVFADILDNNLPAGHFQVVVIAGALQYFPDLAPVMQALFRVLAPGGVIHIIDSPVYPNETAKIAAAQRTRDYYRSHGLEAMADFYHHHTWANLQPFPFVNLNSGFRAWWLQKLKVWTPFPWVEVAPTLH